MASSEITEQDLKKLSGLVEDLKHEIDNPRNTLWGYFDLYSKGSENSYFAELDNEQENELEEFLSITDEVIKEAYLLGTLNEEKVEYMEEFSGNNGFGECADNAIERISEISNDVLDYQRHLLSEDTEEIDIEELVKPLETGYEKLKQNNKVESDFSYKGLGDELTDVNRGFKLVTWTLAKNWASHALNGEEELELGFEVSEEDSFYSIDIWDDGTGLFEDYPDDLEQGREMRYRKANSLFLEEANGHGLPMAAEIAEDYGAQIRYSEEMLENEGFGINIKVPKYQNSTSESS